MSHTHVAGKTPKIIAKGKITKDLSCSPRVCGLSLTINGLLQQMLKIYILKNKTESRVSVT